MNAPLPLAGKRGLVTGIANADSIAWGCAKAFHAMGAELAVTYLNDKALPHVQPLAEQVRADMLMPLNLLHEGELEAVFERLEREWGALDFVLHSIAFAPREDLHGRVTDCSRAGFLQAMDVSCWSFIRMAKLAEPLMKNGGTLFCMSYYGSQMVVEHYNMMGPVKAALESATRYLAAELGPQGIRVHAISPGPLKTRAASASPSSTRCWTAPRQGAGAQPGIHRRRGRGHGLAGHRRRAPHDGADAVYRRRLSHHRLVR